MATKEKKKVIKDESSNNRITTKARYWTAVGYVENMRGDWRDVIGELLQYPYEYIVHDKDKQGDGDDRKTHVHIVIAYGNTTTYKSALALFRKLNAEGKEAFPTCQPVANIKYIHDYLIHDTEDSRKKGKYLYDRSERIAGNNFDIGAFEQLSIADKERMAEELEDMLIERNITNYRELYLFVRNNFDSEYKKILRTYSSHFERLCRGNFLYVQQGRIERMRDDLNGNRTVPDVDEEEEVTEETEEEKTRKQVLEEARLFDEAGLRYSISEDGINHCICEKDDSIKCFDCEEKDDCPIFNPDL